MMSIDTKYTSSASASGGGRNGLAGLTSGMLTVRMASPKELGGAGDGHNPEELFALGYAACFLGATRFAAQSEKLGTVPEDAAVKATVGIGPRAEGGFGLTVALSVSMPGVKRDVAETIIERGHFICPYSHATHGNIAVTTTLT